MQTMAVTEEDRIHSVVRRLVRSTAGGVSLEVLEAAGAEQLAGKVLIDVSNPLDFSSGSLTLSVCNDDSVGERLQRAFPEARVVKTLNTVTASVMVDPGGVGGEHTMFMSGNDEDAKAAAAELLEGFGWPAACILDLGDITGARGQEMYVVLWVRLYGAIGSAAFNVQVRT